MKSECLPSMQIKRIIALTFGALITAVFLVGSLLAASAAADDAVTLSFDTQAAFASRPGGSLPPARELAVFRAKRDAAYRAADQFAKRRLIQFADKDKDELVHLVTDSLSSDLLPDRCRPDGSGDVCTVRAHTVVRLSDFIDARLVSLKLSHAEDDLGYRDEMEPRVPVPLKPGQALAKAYRLIDKHELRMAIIYLDRLAEHYPNWWEIYDLKALALRGQNRPAEMLAALRKACALGSPKACKELK